MRHTQRGSVVVALGTAQTLAWASSYYLPAMLAAPMADDLGVGTPWVFAAFSLALGVSALVAPAAGRLIDRHGGRPVLATTNLLFVLGLVALGLAQGPWSLLAAWALMGVAMGGGLYEAGFATLVRLYGSDSRNVITGITLIAGFASTVGWPLSAWMELQFGWRGACAGWALLHLAVALPLNLALPRAAAQAGAAPTTSPAAVSQEAAAKEVATTREVSREGPPVPATSVPKQQPAAALTGEAEGKGASNSRSPQPAWAASALLAYVFAAVWFVSTSMAAHLPRVLELFGAGLAAAVGAAALVGPAQVAGRVLEFGLLRRVHPLLSARLATLAHPLGALLLAAGAAPLAPLFAVLHGAGNGILTIAKGTLPLALFGPAGYGERQGWLMLPARLAQAAAPLAFDVVLQRFGAQALWLSAALTLSAFAALMALRAPPPPR